MYPQDRTGLSTADHIMLNEISPRERQKTAEPRNVSGPLAARHFVFNDPATISSACQATATSIASNTRTTQSQSGKTGHRSVKDGQSYLTPAEIKVKKDTFWYCCQETPTHHYALWHNSVCSNCEHHRCQNCKVQVHKSTESSSRR